ncbi:hypothetical protein J5N97_020870 [Dioscorea zingiberensis]|uniref:Uncharacterized protein n=1 Tax=Dioscorea zingiberensis TaxID=325984 RepID=A0A9D5CGM1_9LILI|nr:hypothetical protein J5N97_020870 [Dioscorea zingiberensis]
MAKPLGPAVTGEFFKRRDEWRKHPMVGEPDEACPSGSRHCPCGLRHLPRRRDRLQPLLPRFLLTPTTKPCLLLQNLAPLLRPE